MFYPGAAAIDCEQCQKFVYDIETGEQEKYPSGPTRELLPLERNGQPPPCHKCPKKSPQHAKEIELSEKNWQAYAHYQEAKATGLTDAERSDPIVRRNFALLDRLTAERDRQDQARHTAEALIAVLARK